MKTLRPGGFSLTKDFAQAAALTKDSRILDIGCGSGATLAFLQQQYGCSVTGADLSPTAVLLAGDAIGDPAAVCAADAAALPFSSQSFDLILMECTLTLFKNPAAALAESFRLLASGGMLGISALASRVSIARAMRSGASSASALVQDGMVQAPALLSILASCGFSDPQIRDCSALLVQFVADVIFAYGSLADYITTAACQVDGAVLSCDISPQDAGYLYLTARRM